MKLTKKQKMIVSCVYPKCGGFANDKEIKVAKKRARGKFWYDADWDEYCSVSPKGTRRFFIVDRYSWASNKIKKQWRKLARRAAYYWANGNGRKSKKAEKDWYESTN